MATGSQFRIYFSDEYEVPLPAGHRFPMAKYRRLRELLIEREIVPHTWFSRSPLISRESLELTHTSEYLRAVFDGALSESEIRRMGFPWSPQLVDRSRASVGGTWAATQDALECGIGANLAGGTHHAHAAHGEGYCVFNDIAVAAQSLLKTEKVSRIAVVDLDVHQGNGTAAIFSEESRVFTFSMHGEYNFPFRKSPSSLDVGLPDGTGDETYLALLDRHLHDVLERVRPEVVFYQAGVDPLKEDSLGRLALTLEGLAERDRRVFLACQSRHIPVVLTLGGGYAKPIELTLEAHVHTYRALIEVYGFSGT